jgi:chemotaxis protein MotB
MAHSRARGNGGRARSAGRAKTVVDRWDMKTTGFQAGAVGLLVVQAGCVSQAKYDDAAKDATQAKEQIQTLTRRMVDRMREDDRRAGDLSDQIAALQKATQDRDQRLSEANVAAHNLQAHLDESTAMSQQLRAELSRLGKNVDQLLSEKGTLSRALDDAKARLEELRKAQAAADARTALFRDLVAKFKKMSDSGDLKVSVREGRMVLQLPGDVLFDAGKADLRPAGHVALKQVAPVLASLKGRKFQVAGHTDNVAVRGGRFASNWELSSARALSVVRFLVEQGVRPDVLSAAGYGEFDPALPNESPEGKTKNRRIEVVLQPNADEVVTAPDVK